MINYDLKNLKRWIDANKLCLNVTKTKAMFISKSNRRVEIKQIHKNDIHINKETNEIMSEIKLLGVVVDEHLNFDAHLCRIGLQKTD